MDASLRRQVVELRFANRDKEAVDLVRELAEQGDTAAKVAIARMWEAAGLTRHDADEVVDAAHAAVCPDDVIAHLELYGAYAQGMGNVAYEIQARRSFEHLLAAAELDAGHTFSLKVARILLTGAISVPPDVDEARRWYKKAALQGSPDALGELKRYFRS